MDIHQQCVYSSKRYTYIGASHTHLCCDHKERIVHISAEQLPDDAFATKHDSILLPFAHVPHCHRFLYPSDDEYTCFLYCNPVDCIEFLMEEHAFREYMSYAPAQEFNDAEELIFSQVKSSDWW